MNDSKHAYDNANTWQCWQQQIATIPRPIAWLQLFDFLNPFLNFPETLLQPPIHLCLTW
jgi:hypothetical protein